MHGEALHRIQIGDEAAVTTANGREEKRAYRAELSKDCKYVFWAVLDGSHMEEVLSRQERLKKATLGSATLRAVRTCPKRGSAWAGYLAATGSMVYRGFSSLA